MGAQRPYRFNTTRRNNVSSSVPLRNQDDEVRCPRFSPVNFLDYQPEALLKRTKVKKCISPQDVRRNAPMACLGLA